MTVSAITTLPIQMRNIDDPSARSFTSMILDRFVGVGNKGAAKCSSTPGFVSSRIPIVSTTAPASYDNQQN